MIRIPQYLRPLPLLFCISGLIVAAPSVEARTTRRAVKTKRAPRKVTARKPAPQKKAPRKAASSVVAVKSATQFGAGDYLTQSRQRAIELVKQAASAFERGDYKTTVALCKTANDAYPTYSRAYTWMGAAYQKLGNKDEACSAFKWVIALSPNTPDAERAQRGLREMGYYNPTF